LFARLSGKFDNAAGIPGIMGSLQKQIVLFLFKCKRFATVRAGNDPDAIVAHFAPVSNIPEETFGTEMLMYLVNERPGV
jgi:hypothetical protein